jgi:hypothetical protein
VVDVPIVLRSLSVSLASVASADLPIPFDLAFLAMLEGGTNPDQCERVVKSYALCWWKSTRRPADGSLLSADTVDKCLIHHRSKLLKTMSGQSLPARPIIVTPPLQLPSNAEAASDADAACVRCDFHRSLAADLLTELKGIKQFVSGMEATAFNDTDMASRRMAGFYVLHNMVLTKEGGGETPPGIVLDNIPLNQVTKVSGQVGDAARENLERLKAMPAASHKWTWGETLTKDEVIGLGSFDKKFHTGYRVSMKEGRIRGIPDTFHTPRTFSANYSEVSAAARRAPSPTALRFHNKAVTYSQTSTGISEGPKDANADADSRIIADVADHIRADAPTRPTGLVPEEADRQISSLATTTDILEGDNDHPVESLASTYPPSHAHNSLPTTHLWLEMDTSDADAISAHREEPIRLHSNSPPPTNTWLAMVNADYTPHVLEIADDHSVDADAGHSGVTAQIWLSMDNNGDLESKTSEHSDDDEESEHDGVSTTAHNWLSMHDAGEDDDQEHDAGRVADAHTTAQIWLAMDNVADGDGEVSEHDDGAHVADATTTAQIWLAMDNDSDVDSVHSQPEHPNSPSVGDLTIDVDRLAISPTPITLRRRPYASGDFDDLPMSWFTEEPLPSMLDNMLVD